MGGEIEQLPTVIFKGRPDFLVKSVGLFFSSLLRRFLFFFPLMVEPSLGVVPRSNTLVSPALYEEID